MQLKLFRVTLITWNLTIGEALISCFNKPPSFVDNFKQRLSDKELEQLLCKAKELVDWGNLAEAHAIYRQIIILEQCNLQALEEITSIRTVVLHSDRGIVNDFPNSIIRKNNYSRSLFKTNNFRYYYNLMVASNQKERIEEIMAICNRA